MPVKVPDDDAAADAVTTAETLDSGETVPSTPDGVARALADAVVDVDMDEHHEM
jgi:hypothetical protein